MTSNQHTAYTNASHMVRKTKQIVMLYEGAIRAVQHAKKAIGDNNIESKYNALTKACDIINGLQISIDHDNGGEVAQTLYDYYAGLDMRLMSIHASNDVSLCDLCIKHLQMMKDVWMDIDNNEKDAPEAQLSATQPNIPNNIIQKQAAEAVASYNFNA